MAEMDDIKELVVCYKRKIEKETEEVKVLRILKKFKLLPVSVELLQATGIGKTISRLRKWDGEVGRQARDLVAEWKGVVTGTRVAVAEDREDAWTKQPGSSCHAHQDVEHERKRTDVAIGLYARPGSRSMKSRKLLLSSHAIHENGTLDRQESPAEEVCENVLLSPSPKRMKSSRETTMTSPGSRTPETNVASKEASQSVVGRASHKHSSKKKGRTLVDAGGDGFNASMASFEDCLGLNDAKHSLKKKKAVNSVTSPLNSGSQHDTQRPVSNSLSSQTNSKSTGISLSPVASGSHGSSPVPLLKKPQTTDVDILSSLPAIQTDYKPLRFVPPDSPPPPTKKKAFEMDSTTFMSSRHTRTQVFSGRRSLYLTEVPTLMKCCIKVLQENVNVLGDLQYAPYDHIKHVLLRCSPDRLLYLEEINPYLLEDSDELWMIHCQRDFKNGEREEFETWRELYYRLSVNRDAKLKSITANICASMAKALPVRQTKLAYVDCEAKPPRSVARQQARFGTGGIKCAALKETVVKLGRSAGSGFTDSKLVSSHGSSTVSPASTSSDAGLAHSNGPALSLPQSQKVVKKVAPLMQKTLKFMKNRFRR